MKSELGQGVEHFRRAATLAAQETGATVGPKWSAARDRVQPAVSQAKGAATTGWGSAIATLAPLVTAAADNVRQTGKESKKLSRSDRKQAAKNAKKLQKRADKAVGRKRRGKGGKLFGLALAGAAVGAGAAYAAKRRRAAQWDEYDPSAPISSTETGTGADDAAFEPADTLDPAVVPSTGTTSTTTTTGSTGTTSTTGTTATTGGADPEVVTGSTDQTASHQHSPKVARMAGGQNNTKD